MSSLDIVLYKGEEPLVSYFYPSTGEPFTDDSYKLTCMNAKNKVYPATDHTPFLIVVGDIKFLYVSLDNSVRANMNGNSLVASERLEKICEIVDKINPDIVFYSEACRKSFEGGMNEQKNPVYWIEMKQTIAKLTNMVFLQESANNFDFNCMSFGVACFGKESVLTKIESILPYQLLLKSETCTGSGSVVVRLRSKSVVIGVHFPLDFVRVGKDNNNTRALASLLELVNIYPSSDVVYAMGDMNTIEGTILTSMLEVLKESEWKLTDGKFTRRNSLFVSSLYSSLTFFPSYFDFIGRDEPYIELYEI